MQLFPLTFVDCFSSSSAFDQFLNPRIKECASSTSSSTQSWLVGQMVTRSLPALAFSTFYHQKVQNKMAFLNLSGASKDSCPQQNNCFTVDIDGNETLTHILVVCDSTSHPLQAPLSFVTLNPIY